MIKLNNAILAMLKSGEKNVEMSISIHPILYRFLIESCDKLKCSENDFIEMALHHVKNDKEAACG